MKPEPCKQKLPVRPVSDGHAVKLEVLLSLGWADACTSPSWDLLAISLTSTYVANMCWWGMSLTVPCRLEADAEASPTARNDFPLAFCLFKQQLLTLLVPNLLNDPCGRG